MTSKTNTVTISAQSAKYLADAMLAAASKDDVTPVICAAQITVTPEELRGLATDRYRVHTVALNVQSKPKAHEFVVPRDALLWLSKNALAFTSRRYTAFDPIVKFTTRAPGEANGDHGYLKLEVRQSIDSGDVDGVISRTGPLVKGNFPPVGKLFEKARAAELHAGPFMLKPELLSSLRVLGGKWDVPLIRPTASENPAKPGPVHFEFKQGDRVFAEALIQPNLIVR